MSVRKGRPSRAPQLTPALMWRLVGQKWVALGGEGPVVLGAVLIETNDGLQLARIGFQGLAEAVSPLILGFGILTVVAMLMAVGYRRLVARLPAV